MSNLVMTDRMQGVDCYWCEDGTPHRHEPPAPKPEPLYVVLSPSAGPIESFVEIETADGRSVCIPSTIDAGGYRRIGPLYAVLPGPTT